MNELKNEIISFLKETGIPAYTLATQANVSRALISRLINGKQKDVSYSSALSIKRAISEFSLKN